MPKYNPHAIEPKWQNHWVSKKTFKTERVADQPKFYCLDMFPYPSSNGLHVGHPEGYTATDIVCRYKRMRGFNVLHPIGWDAFGLPAEQHAIKTGTHPRITTEENINNFRRQIQSLGFSYDWDREINTSDPKYFRWTQWIFKKLFESWYDTKANKARPISELVIPHEIRGDNHQIQAFLDLHRLAYMDEIAVWWCPELGTVLANEEVIDGKSERGDFPCERKPMRQWVLRITAYAERLIDDLQGLDWSDSIKMMQKNWIGRSQGAEVSFDIKGRKSRLEIFTTRPDTLFGATYMVMAPEHPYLDTITTPAQENAVEAYKRQAAGKSDLERGMEKDKTGVFTGAYAINPVNGAEIPIYTADYVMMGYGTGAIMAVPAHDERDYAFAKKFDLPIVEVISGGDISTEAYTGDGVLVNSGFLNGLDVETAKEQIIAWLEEKHRGRAKVQYRLRDWLFSRQRYWGEPFPIVHTDTGPVAVPDEELPVELPALEDYRPTGTFEPPLAKAREWATYKGKDGIKGTRELNTMPQWAGSSWYYLRYLSPESDEAPFTSDAEKHWMSVDLYIGGAEHAVLHLLYARFWHKVLFDLGYVSTREPFHKLVNQGLILGEDGEKMSKSRGNVVNPDDVVKEYGADSLRLYEMFMGPLERMKPWQTAGIEGLWRFLNKVWRLTVGDDRNEVEILEATPPENVRRALHRTIAKVGDDIEGLRFNTGISALMILCNELTAAYDRPVCHREAAETLVLLTAPYAPHIAEEIWERLGHSESLAYEPWPEFDPALIVEDTVTVVLQANGKVRARLEVAKDTPEDELEKMARSDAKFATYLENQDIIRVIRVKDKLVNFVVKPKG